MAIEKVKWNPLQEWVYITTKYGKMLTFDTPYFYEAKESLRYQPRIRECLETGNYDVFLDVGAFHGYFSMIASILCKNVRCYEANPFHFGILAENMKHLFNVVCKYGFVGNHNSVGLSARDVSNLVGCYGEKCNLEIYELDKEIQVTDEKVLIKLDVEGNEISVLEGALDLIKNPNVHWCIDVHTQNQGITHEKITSFFDQNREIIHFEKYMEVLG